jgi:hypothetical protein
MNIKTWFSKKIGMLSLALSNVEKNALSQSGEGLSSDVTQTRRITQGQLADSLINGEITQEVLNLKWRTYKVLKASEGVTAEIVGYDEDGMPITKVRKKNKKNALAKVKLDSFHDYKLEMVVDNTEIVIGGNDAMENDDIEFLDEVVLNYNDKGEVESATHGNISISDYLASHKTEKPIFITRKEQQKFNLENYTKKLNVRSINGDSKMLEFYVSMYADEYNRSSRLFISEIKKIMSNEISSTSLDIDKINFISYKTLGSDDFLEYEYIVKGFDSIIEFNGYYVIKFICDVSINGKDILEEHRVESLDKKYNEKAKK